MENKESIRKTALSRRKTLTQEEMKKKSSAICRKLLQLPEFLESKHVYVYMDIKKEVMTRDFIKKAWALGKTVAVPKVHGDEMDFYWLTSFAQLEPGFFGVAEPTYGDVAGDEDAFILIPGVAFDVNRDRIGYGRGYYDKYLAKHPKLRSVAVAYDLQVFPEIPHEELDIRPSVLVTETEIYR